MTSWLRRLLHSLNLKAFLIRVSILVVLMGVLSVVLGSGGLRGAFAPVAFLLLSIPVAIASSFRDLLRYRTWISATPASEYTTRLKNAIARHCLVLRPFGADGHLFLDRVADTKGWLRERLIHRGSSTVEELLAASMVMRFEMDTICLIDPKAALVPPGPIFLTADAQWRQDIDGLLRQANVVVFVFPPNHAATSSVEWEIQRALALGLQGRMFFLFPPPSMLGAAHAREAAQALTRYFPPLEELLQTDVVATGLLAVYPEATGTVRVWYTKKDPIDAAGYLAVIQEILDHMERGRTVSKRPVHLRVVS